MGFNNEMKEFNCVLGISLSEEQNSRKIVCDLLNVS